MSWIMWFVVGVMLVVGILIGLVALGVYVTKTRRPYSGQVRKRRWG